MEKTKKTKILALVPVVIAMLLAAVLIVGGQKNAAYAQDKTDLLITDFTAGKPEQWTTNDFAVQGSDGIDMIGGGELQTVPQLRGFLMRMDLGSVQKGLKVSFGKNGTDEPFALTFDGTVLSLENITAANGENTFLLPNAITSGGSIQIELVGTNLTLGIRQDGQPADVMGSALCELKLADGMSSRYGQICISAPQGSALTVKAVQLYSLSGAITIETENYVAPDTSDDNPEPVNISVILLATLIPAGVLLAGGAVAVTLVTVRRKRK